jgi:hypothetical protein
MATIPALPTSPAHKIGKSEKLLRGPELRVRGYFCQPAQGYSLAILHLAVNSASTAGLVFFVLLLAIFDSFG